MIKYAFQQDCKFFIYLFLCKKKLDYFHNLANWRAIWMEVWPNPTQIGVNINVQFVVLALTNEFIKDNNGNWNTLHFSFGYTQHYCSIEQLNKKHTNSYGSNW